MNIVSLIMQFLAPQLLGKFASALGINSTLAQKVIAAALPAILAGLAGKASQSGGGQVLADAIGKQDPGLLGKLGEMIGGAQQKTVVEQGNNVLGSLLGNSALGSLAGALGKFGGLGDGASKSLIGMLAPVILGQLGAQQKSGGLDAAGLAKMLIGQKDNIAKAIPGDFAKLLGGSGLLDSVQANMPANGAKVAGSTGSMATGNPIKDITKAAQAAQAAAHTHHHFSWWPWLLAIGLAGLLWWNTFGAKLLAPAMIAPPAAPIFAGNVDIGQELASVFDNLRSAANGVTDAGSARAALPRLQDQANRLDRVGSLAPSLAPDAKRALASYAATNLSNLSPVLGSLLNIPGVSAALKPVIDQVLGRMTQLAKL